MFMLLIKHWMFLFDASAKTLKQADTEEFRALDRARAVAHFYAMSHSDEV